MTAASDFYTSLRAGIKSLLSDDGVKSCVVTVTRVTSANQEPDADWASSTPTTLVYTMDAVVVGVEQEYVDGDLVKADDLQVICPPYATRLETEASFEPRITDEFSIDGVTHVANKIERIPASGTAVAFFIFVKS
jgi:hypothetical protein